MSYGADAARLYTTVKGTANLRLSCYTLLSLQYCLRGKQKGRENGAKYITVWSGGGGGEVRIDGWTETETACVLKV